MASSCKACLITGLDVAVMTGAAYCQDCVQRLPQGVCPNCTYINGELDDICKQCGASVIIDSTSKANDSRKLKPSGSHPEAPHKKTQVQQIATSSIPTTQVPMDTSTDDTMPVWAKSLRADILLGFDQVIDSKLAPLQADITYVKSNVNKCNETANSALQAAKESQEAVSALRADVDKRFMRVKEELGKNPTDSQSTTTVVIAGFGDDFAQASAWTLNELHKAGLDTPTNTYHKGDDFNGLIFLKYPEAKAALHVIESFNNASRQYGGKPVWCKQDFPFSERVCRSFLFGLRKTLISWEFNKNSVSVDESTLSFSVEGKPVLSVSVSTNDDSIDIEWIEQAWAEWNELRSSNEFTSLQATATKKLTAAAEKRAKGTGKGKCAKTSPS